MKPIVGNVLSAATLVVLMFAAVSADAGTNYFAASPSNAIVWSPANSQSCLADTWGRTLNNCNYTVSIDYGQVNVNNQGVYYTYTVDLYNHNGDPEAPICNALGLSQDGNTYWSSGYQGNYNLNTTASVVLSQVWMPTAGYTYLQCQLTHLDQLNSFRVSQD